MTARCRRQVAMAVQAATGSAQTVDTLFRGTCDLRPVVTKIRPEEDIGSYAPTRHYIAGIHGEGTLKMDATYEQILIPLSMAMLYVDPTGSYVWAWPLPYTTTPATYLWTIEYIDQGPVNGGGSYCVRMIDVFATDITISGEAGQGWKVECSLTGGTIDLPDTLSSNVSLDETVTPILMAETTLQVDADYASIGGSTVEELISFNWKMENYKHGKQFAGSLYPNSKGYGQWKTTLELVLEISAAEAQTFCDSLLATTQYAVRIKGYNSATDYCYIDGMYMVEDVSALDERDGNNIIKITLLGEKDSSDNTGVITVQTDIDAL